MSNQSILIKVMASKASITKVLKASITMVLKAFITMVITINLKVSINHLIKQ